MGYTEIFACDGGKIIPRQRFARRKGDRMNHPIEAVPMLAQLGEQVGDLFVAGDIAGKNQRGAKLGGEFGNAFLDALALVGKSQFGPFAFANSGNAIRNGTIGNDAGDQNAFAREEAHDLAFV